MSLIILAGPAGVGKGSVVRQILATEPDFQLSVSATTRPPRPAEADGVDYHFVSDAEFDGMISRGELLEWAVVHGAHRYGTPSSELTRAAQNEKHLLLEIDLQGARQVRDSHPEAITIFLMPPSQEELEARLRGRATETEAQISQRLKTARDEIDAKSEFMHVVINNDLSECVKAVVNLARAERGK